MAVETPTEPLIQTEAPTTDVIKGLPPGPNMPQTIQSIGFMVRNIPMMRRARAKYGEMFRIKLMAFPNFVIISDPELIKQVLTEKPDVLHAGTGSPLGAVLGANSLLAIDEDFHLRQRRIMLPAFHGDRMRDYGPVIEEIADAEMDTWPVGEQFATLEPMQRITLRVILKTIFGAHDESLDKLEYMIPKMVEIGTRVVLLRFAQRDLGPRSPWGQFLRLRDQAEEVMLSLMDEARRDPNLAERSDVMSILVQATHEDGTPMSDREIMDQLVTMMIAGHETTASTLAWAVERLSRNPRVLDNLTQSVRAGETEYLNAVFDETLRARPTVSLAVRSVQKKPYVLNGYELPVNTRIGCNPALTHYDPNLFADPGAFRPERFLEERPSNYAYIPFGGGVRRCIGAAFARMEFNTVMTRMLDRFDLEPTDAPPERWGFRSITFAPGDEGLVTLKNRA